MKPEFEKLLGDDKDKFIENVRNCTIWGKDKSLDERLDSLNDEPSFVRFISCAFVWEDTPIDQGIDFWCNIANRK